MDWDKVLNAFLSGSPWAVMLILGYVVYKLRDEYIKVIDEKEAIVEAKDKRIRELNDECKKILCDAALTASQIQEKRIEDATKNLKEMNHATADLNMTLNGLILAMRKRDD
jgi:hypothetical protein